MDDERRREEESSLHGYEHEFERAAEELKVEAASKRVYVSDPQKIKLYSLYKQATEGDCSKPQPSASSVFLTQGCDFSALHVLTNACLVCGYMHICRRVPASGTCFTMQSVILLSVLFLLLSVEVMVFDAVYVMLRQPLGASKVVRCFLVHMCEGTGLSDRAVPHPCVILRTDWQEWMASRAGHGSHSRKATIRASSD